MRELVLQVGHSGTIQAAAFSPDGTLLASGGADGVVRLWNVETGELCRTRRFQERISALRFSPNGTLIAAVIQHDVVLCETNTLEPTRSLRGHGGAVHALDFSPCGLSLATGAGDLGCVRLWDAGTGTLIRQFRPHKPGVNTLAYSPDGQLLATGSRRRGTRGVGEIKLWEVDSAELRATLH